MIKLLMLRIIAAFAILILAASLALASDLNTFRAEHKRPPLTYSVTLAVAAQEHARDMARRNTLDHKNFKERIGPISGGTSAENVAYGCPDEPCVIKMWARSKGHRANMLRRDVSAYGIASADADNGRRYWVMELGN